MQWPDEWRFLNFEIEDEQAKLDDGKLFTTLIHRAKASSFLYLMLPDQAQVT